MANPAEFAPFGQGRGTIHGCRIAGRGIQARVVMVLMTMIRPEQGPNRGGGQPVGAELQYPAVSQRRRHVSGRNQHAEQQRCAERQAQAAVPGLSW